MWQYALWSRTWDWDGRPSRRRIDAKFKWIAIDAGAIRHPAGRPRATPRSIRRDLDPPSRAAIAS